MGPWRDRDKSCLPDLGKTENMQKASSVCCCYETTLRDPVVGLHQSRGETSVSPWDGSHQSGGTRVKYCVFFRENHVVTLFLFLRSIYKVARE